MPRLEDLDLSQLPEHVYDGHLVDLHDLITVLNFVRANKNPYLRSTKLVEVTKQGFETTKLARTVEKKWSSADPNHRVGMVFDVQIDDDDDDDEIQESEELEIPKYFTPSTMIKQPIPPSLSNLSRKELETLYWQAQNHGGSTRTTEFLKCLFQTWPEAPLFIRVRIPPFQAMPRVEYITYAPRCLQSIEFTLRNPKELSVTVTPGKTFVNGAKGEVPYSVIGFSPMQTMASDPDPVDTILDLCSMQHGEAGWAFKFPFILTRKEEYIDKHLPSFGESNTFSHATYNQIASKSSLGAFDADTIDIVTSAREYCMMKVRHKAAYCAYCGMPEMVGPGLYSIGCPMDRCSVCRTEYYCSEEHQKAAWSYHKHFCQPYSETSRRMY